MILTTFRAKIPATLTITLDAENEEEASRKIKNIVEKYRQIVYEQEACLDIEANYKAIYKVEEWLPF